VLSRHTETPGQHIQPCRRALAQVSIPTGTALWLGSAFLPAAHVVAGFGAGAARIGGVSSFVANHLRKWLYGRDRNTTTAGR
jgi:hypothetical protein